MILLLYVDDLFLIGEDELIAYEKRSLAIEFKMKYLGMMLYLLVMKVWQSADGIFLGQGKYALEILKRFGMLDCKAIATPMASNLKLMCDASSESIDSMMYCQIIGSLMYLKNARPNRCFAINTLSQFLMDL